MVTAETLAAFCAWLRENANSQSIPAIVRFEEEVCDSLEYSALKKAADTHRVFLRSKSSGGRNGVLHISYREICLFL